MFRKKKEVAKNNGNPFNDPSSIGNILMKLGKLTRDQLCGALCRHAQLNDALLGALLREMGYVTADDVIQAIRIQEKIRNGDEISAELDVLQCAMDRNEAQTQEMTKAIAAARSRRRVKGESTSVTLVPLKATGS